MAKKIKKQLVLSMHQEHQLCDLITETILPAIIEDLGISEDETPELYNDALDRLITELTSHKV